MQYPALSLTDYRQTTLDGSLYQLHLTDETLINWLMLHLHNVMIHITT